MYSGGDVLDPVSGQHRNVLTFDVLSHLYNISSETICFECCKDNPDARIPTDVMNDINQRLYYEYQMQFNHLPQSNGMMTCGNQEWRTGHSCDL